MKEDFFSCISFKATYWNIMNAESDVKISCLPLSKALNKVQSCNLDIFLASFFPFGKVYFL